MLTGILAASPPDKETLVSLAPHEVGGGDHPSRSFGVCWGLLWLSVHKALSSWDGEDTSGHSREVVVEQSPRGGIGRGYLGSTLQLMG